jgi:dipeptidyl aminopeptidase/acylaminoacyl peptidase
MRRSCLLNALLIFFAAALQAQDSVPRPVTTDDGLDMVRVGDALMSPDGQWVFFSESRLDWGENQRKTTYHMIPASGGESFQYIGEAGGSSFQFSPDGKHLSFRRTVEEQQQIFLMRTNGGEAVQLTKHENSISSYKWGHDSRTIFFLAAEPRTKDEEKKHEDGYDAVFVDEGPNGQQEGSWNNLWRFSIDSKKEERITEEEFRVGSWDVSPDGKRIVFSARYENRRNQGNLSDVYLYNTEDSSKIRLTENQAPESGMQWAPDGSRFMYTAVSADTWELRQGKIWIMDSNTREFRMVSGAFEGSISNPVWAPDGKVILFTGRDRTNTNLYELDVNSGSVEQLTHMVGTLSVSSYSQDRNTVVYSFSDLSTPSDLYVTSTRDFDPVRLTHANPWVETDLTLAQGEVIRWNSKDGLEIEGILVLPIDYVEGSRPPLLLHVHGGPAGVFTNTFRSSSHVWAGLGFAQLFPNVRGSSSYSDEFLQGNMHDIGGGDFWDLMTGVDHLINQGYVDADRMGIRWAPWCRIGHLNMLRASTMT